MTEKTHVQNLRTDPPTKAVSNEASPNPLSYRPSEHPGSPQPSRRHIRRIGPVGTFARIVSGIWLVYLAAFEQGTLWDWELALHEAILGIVVFPAVMVFVVLVARRFSNGPIRLMGSLGFALNTVVIILLLEGRYTHDAALLFYGLSFPIAAWRDLPGCEVTAVSNLILKRDDQIGCPILAPVDEVERKMKRARPMVPGSAQINSGDPSKVQELETEWWRSMLPIGVCLGVGIVTVLILELS